MSLSPPETLPVLLSGFSARPKLVIWPVLSSLTASVTDSKNLASQVLVVLPLLSPLLPDKMDALPTEPRPLTLLVDSTSTPSTLASTLYPSPTGSPLAPTSRPPTP